MAKDSLPGRRPSRPSTRRRNALELAARIIVAFEDPPWKPACGDGEKHAMPIPWGDVSTAYTTTGIPNIEVYIPGSSAMVARAGHAQRFKWLLGMGVVQNIMKRRIEKTVKGPSNPRAIPSRDRLSRSSR